MWPPENEIGHPEIAEAGGSGPVYGGIVEIPN
jgi:hypothetical protein